MKSLKNYKYKVFNKEYQMINEIGRVFQAVTNYNRKGDVVKVEVGLSLITNYQDQIKKFQLKQKSLKTDMYV